MSGIRATYRTGERTLLALHFPAAWDTPAHIEAVARSLSAVHDCPVTFHAEMHRTPAEMRVDEVRRLLCDAHGAHADVKDAWRERTA